MKLGSSLELRERLRVIETWGLFPAPKTTRAALQRSADRGRHRIGVDEGLNRY
jgi:hypothetical protein